MNLSARQRVLEEIRLLCQCGVGLEAIASPLCDATRRLTAADAAALFWHDEQGSILGFCHDLAPDEIKELFILRFDELFAPPGGNRINEWLLKSDKTIGTALDPPPEYFESANFKLLIQPSGHHWPFDCRVDIGGVPRATMLLYNSVERPFDRSYIELLRPVQALMRRAIEIQKTRPQWQAEPQTRGSLLADLSGKKLLAISDSARTLFSRCQMMLYDKTIVGSTSRAPTFVMQLALLLADQTAAELHFGVIGGRLAVTATRLASAEAGSADTMLVDIVFERAAEVITVEHVLGLTLSPLQREIVLHAMLGRSRAECSNEFGITEEALKKHLKVIYRITGAANWSSLATSQAYKAAVDA